MVRGRPATNSGFDLAATCLTMQAELPSPWYSYPPSSPAARLHAVHSLVESIRKHKKFKQLASYSISCLEKVISPPRIGWEVNAQAAHAAGAAEDIADACARFSTDAEVFTLSISSLRSIATVPRAMPSLLERAVASQILQAVRGYWGACELTTSAGPEPLMRLAPAMDLLQQMARADPAAFSAAGGAEQLLDLASAEPPAAGQRVGKAGAALLAGFAGVLTSASAALDRLSRSKPGLEALSAPAAIARLLVAATRDLRPPSRWEAARKSFRLPAKGGAAAAGGVTSPGGGGGGGGSAATGAGGSGTDNSHLPHLFRVLERVARSDAGRDALLGAGATTRLSAIMGSVAAGKGGAQTEALAMRVLARLLGANVAELIEKVVGAGSAAGQERALAARLLASLTRDEDHVKVILANGAAHLRRIILRLKENGSGAEAPPLVQASRQARGGAVAVCAPMPHPCRRYCRSSPTSPARTPSTSSSWRRRPASRWFFRCSRPSSPSRRAATATSRALRWRRSAS